MCLHGKLKNGSVATATAENRRRNFFCHWARNDIKKISTAVAVFSVFRVGTFNSKN